MKTFKISTFPIIGMLFFLLLLSCSKNDSRINVELEYPVLPILTCKYINPVFRIRLLNTQEKPYQLKQITLSLGETTDIQDICQISLFDTDKNGMMDPQTPIGDFSCIDSGAMFTHAFTIETDTFDCWVAVKLKEMVNLSNRIKISCEKIETEQGVLSLTGQPQSVPLRVGVALRQSMQDGVHTSRIPGLTTSNQGTLLAIYDARWENARDLQGDIDIALNRSTDKGRTWEKMQIIMDRKEWGGLPEKFNGVSDACILVDRNKGHIYVAGLWMHGLLDGESGKWIEGLTADSSRWIHQWVAKGSQPGFDVKQTSQFLITKSTDDGLTWSEPVNITRQTKKEEWWLYAPAPGHGITLKDGTLIFPTQGRDKHGIPFSNITWSKDGGKTWVASSPAHFDVTECMAVELSDGSVMLNMRDNRNRNNEIRNGRTIAITHDLGETWREHPTSGKALIEPTCMASIHKHTYTRNGEEHSILLFANPESKTKREKITLKVSFDDGNTWPEEKKILLDEYIGRGYSCITSVDESTIGILYESSQAQMVYQQILLEELIGKGCLNVP